MTILRSLKFKSTVSCVLTVLAVSTFVACGNDDNGSNNPAGVPPQSPNAQSLAAQQQQEEAARQAALLAQQQQQQQQEEAARQAAALAAQREQDALLAQQQEAEAQRQREQAVLLAQQQQEELARQQAAARHQAALLAAQREQDALLAQQQEAEALRQREQAALLAQQQREELARQQAALLAQQQELEPLRAPKYLGLKLSAFTAENLQIARDSAINLTGGTRTAPGMTPVGCIKLTINNAATITDPVILQALGQISSAYMPGSNIDLEEDSGGRPIRGMQRRSLETHSATSADLLATGFGDCGSSNPEASNRCVIGVLTEAMDRNIDRNWWRTDARLNATVYFNPQFNADIAAMRYICMDIIAGQFVEATP